jgi:hypothetical protein
MTKELPDNIQKDLERLVTSINVPLQIMRNVLNSTS